MRTLLSVLAVLLVAVNSPAAEPEKKDEVIADLVYGRKDGMALTLDILKPARPSGPAILWLQSGGWYSRWTDPKLFLQLNKPHLDKGITVIIVRHGSAPKYTVPEAIDDVRRAVRFVRLKGKEYGVDPERLGVMGMSAGGHLSLMLGTTGDDGDPKSADPVLRQPSRVAAVAAICPPTDLRGWTTDPPEEIKKHAGLKPPLSFDAKREPDCSPLLKVTGKAAPALMVHGELDKLVPIEPSKNMVTALEKASVPCKLVAIEGAGHGFTPQQNEKTIVPAITAWFDKHLAAAKKAD